jgi:putative flavoprotein involved in K+ transport
MKEEIEMQQAQNIETVIVGGGQAGLAVGYFLKQSQRPFVILDAGERVGDSWRERWPSLRLYSPAKLDGLPGMPFPAPRRSFPTGEDMADYLESYAERFQLPVRSGVRVQAVEQNGHGYVVSTDAERIQADNVVVATGVFHHDSPYIPDFAAELDPRITQLHSADYRSPGQLQPGPVLVVGAAHSGGDVAYEVARAGHATILSGRDTGQIPFDIEARPARFVFPILAFVWTRVLTVSTPMGRKAKSAIRVHGGPLLRVKRADLQAAGVERVTERTVGVVDGKPALADGRVLDIANVVWCTGFRNDYSWIRLPLPLEEDGYPAQRHGVVAELPGLYFAGMPFLHSFASMLILGAGRDGKRVAEHIVRRMSKRPSADLLEPVAA